MNRKPERRGQAGKANHTTSRSRMPPEKTAVGSGPISSPAVRGGAGSHRSNRAVNSPSAQQPSNTMR
jgi:hypothetical protein